MASDRVRTRFALGPRWVLSGPLLAALGLLSADRLASTARMTGSVSLVDSSLIAKHHIASQGLAAAADQMRQQCAAC
ncbi:hypothetical protein [Thermogemmatispora sp.]|uniref:hypothetical protein n=1 Tax=Thermogemmatispora sp. TaxID=1968838 RepID=UPI001D5D4A35|nr:hypothetical protein [Thermogemmatispora sp.]MBX5449401.1 hypothetical protein [Thermogemmatispora sp.]